MRKDVFGLIYAGEENLQMRELTAQRSLAALPIGGRYREVDFVLSNMVNSGIRNVGVVPFKNYQSLMDHLGSGKAWNLNRKSDGLFILPPYDNAEDSGVYRGTLDALRGAGPYLRRVPQQYCLLTGSFTVYHMTYNDMLDYHLKSGADITILYNTEDNAVQSGKLFQDLRLGLDENGRVTDLVFRPQNPGLSNVGMDTYLIKKDLLQYLIDASVSRQRHKFIQDVLVNNPYHLNIRGYRYDGYVGRLHSVASYMKLNMDFLKEEVQQKLFYTGSPVYTKIKDGAPTKYGPAAQVTGSLIASGCRINGRVENSILFRGVQIGKNVSVKNSVIMQDSIIYEDSDIEWVIIDKKASVGPRTILKGSMQYPVVIPKGEMV